MIFLGTYIIIAAKNGLNITGIGDTLLLASGLDVLYLFALIIILGGAL